MMLALVRLDRVDQSGEQRGASGLAVAGGVVALAEEHGLEGLVGGEVGAVLADRFEAAIELGGPSAPTVAEEPEADLAA